MRFTTLRVLFVSSAVLLFAACSGHGSSVPQTGGGNNTFSSPNVPANVRPACGAPKPGTASCFALIRTDSAGTQSALRSMSVHPMAATYSGPFTPADIKSFYNLPAGSGTPTIAIVDAYNDPTVGADLYYYRKYFGLPNCTLASGCLRVVNQNGQSSPLPADACADPNTCGWSAEESLDVDMVSAACPNCKIVLVEANSDNFSDLETAEDAAYYKLGVTPVAISNSYGGAEDGTTSNVHYDHHYSMIVASTGDSTWYVGPSMPASYQSVIAVGGTTIYRNAGQSTRGGNLEVAWSYGGSGCSFYVPAPAWQSQTLTQCGGFRAMSDVSAVADPVDPGVWFYDSYSDIGFDIVGGTSASAPIVAGVYGLANNSASVGWTYGKSLWTHPTGFNDITIGDNGFCGKWPYQSSALAPAIECNATAGWDGPTGWGTPNGTSAF